MYIVNCAQKDYFKAVFVMDSFVYNSSQIITLLKAEGITSDLGKLPHASDQRRHRLCELGPRSGLVIAEAI